MTDTDDLTDLIENPTGGLTPRQIAQRIIDAGYRRVVVDDAMIERARAAADRLFDQALHTAGDEAGRQRARDDRAALTAALNPKDTPVKAEPSRCWHCGAGMGERHHPECPEVAL